VASRVSGECMDWFGLIQELRRGEQK
jgi:hypothetical protein